MGSVMGGHHIRLRAPPCGGALRRDWLEPTSGFCFELLTANFWLLASGFWLLASNF
jgi:hypothetical protein